MASSEQFWKNYPDFLPNIWGSALFVICENQIAQFYILAASLGISKPDNMYTYYSRSKEINLEWAIKRFEQVGRTTQHIWRRAREINPELYECLITPRHRNGMKGKYEPDNVPDEYFFECPAVVTPTGWAAPRLLALALEKKPNIKISDILDPSLKESTDLVMFLCTLANKISQAGVPAEEIINLVLKHHIMEEQNNRWMYFEVIDKLIDTKLWTEVEVLYQKEIIEEKPEGWARIIKDYKSTSVQRTE